MHSQTLQALTLLAALAAPTLAAVGDTYNIKSGGKQYALATVSALNAGTIAINDDALDDLIDALDSSLSSNYNTAGEAEYAGSVTAQGQKIEGTVDTSDSHSTLKECFTEVQWSSMHSFFLTSVIPEQESNDKTPAVLTIDIQNTNTAGTVQGPCRAAGDCQFFFEYNPTSS